MPSGSAAIDDDIGDVERPVVPLQAWHSFATEVADAIHALDVAIWDWAVLLKRAQPHRAGRLVVRFQVNRAVRLDGTRFFWREPCLGKLVPTPRGWRFFRLGEQDKYEKLSDLRVGKTLKSDPLVVKILDGIEEMLNCRNELVDSMFALRRQMLFKAAAGTGLANRLGVYGVTLGDRIKLDWSLGAGRAEAILLEERRARHVRYQINKTKKIARDIELSELGKDL